METNIISVETNNSNKQLNTISAAVESKEEESGNQLELPEEIPMDEAISLHAFSSTIVPNTIRLKRGI